MSKVIKVFSGSATTTNNGTPVTLYTVPAGRVAKIEFSNLYVAASQNNFFVGSSPCFSVGSYSGPIIGNNISGTSIAQFPSSYSTTTATYMSSNSGSLAGQKNIVGVILPDSIPQFYFLTAGQTVKTMVDTTFGAGISTNYSFSVVEEY